MPPATPAPRRRRGACAWARAVVPVAVAVGAVGVVGAPPRAAAAPYAVGAPDAVHAPARPAAAPAPTDLARASWWWDAMGVDELHRSGTGAGVTVALIDTPINPEVRELRGRIAASSSPCLVDADGRTASPSSTGAEAEHATSMAALIAGTGRGTAPGGAGIRGIAPDARLLHYAVLYREAPDAERATCGIRAPRFPELSEGIARSIRRAVDDGADIINLSLTSGYDADFAPAMLEAYRAGAIIVAGTSNERRDVLWPAMGNGVVVVNPVDRSGLVYGDSVRSAFNIALAAPGRGVNSFGWDGGAWHSDYRSDGSSNATALVSGGLAAMWSAHPDATGNQILQAARAGVGLRRTGDGVQTWFRREGTDLPEVTEANPAYGWGIFAPADAVALDPTTLPDENPFLSEVRGAEPSAQEVRAATSAPATGATSRPAPAGPTAATVAAPRPGATAEGAGSPWGLVSLGVLALAVAAAGGVLVARRRGPAPGTPGDSSTGGDPDDTVTTGAAGARPGARADGEE